jgi:hypothetical protein
MPFQFKSKPFHPIPRDKTKYLLQWKPSLLNTELPDLLFDDKMLFQTLLANQLLLENKIEPDTRSFMIKKIFTYKSHPDSFISGYSIMFKKGNVFHSCKMGDCVNCLTKSITLRIRRKLTSISVGLFYINKNDIRYVINIIKYIIECAVDLQIQAIQQKGRDIRNLSYLTKRLQGNPDVLSTIAGFLVKGTPREEWERMEGLKTTLKAEMEGGPIVTIRD